MPSAKSSPRPKVKTHAVAFEAIGTQWFIEFELDPKTDPAVLVEAVHALIADFDHTYSRFLPDSVISAIASRAGKFRLPDTAESLLAWYKRLYAISGGAVTPLIGNLLSDAGYDAAYSLQPKQLRNVPSWESALTYEAPYLTVAEPVLLDFGAAGKGYLVDLVGELLENAGCKSYLVDAGGDMRVRGSHSRRIGLEDPGNSSQVLGVVKLNNASLCGSAGNKRAWGEFHHIVDPHKKASPEHIAAVWVLADTTMKADGLTTALFFVDPVQLQRQEACEYAILYHDYSLVCSKGFPATFFESKEGADNNV